MAGLPKSTGLLISMDGEIYSFLYVSITSSSPRMTAKQLPRGRDLVPMKHACGSKRGLVCFVHPLPPPVLTLG